MSDKYVITADKYTGTIGHNFFEGFSISVKDDEDKVVVAESGMTLHEVQNKVVSLCKEAGIRELTVKDLAERGGTYTVEINDMVALIHY